MLKSTAFRFDEITDKMIDQLAVALGTTRTGAVRHAVRALHKREGLTEGRANTKRKPITRGGR